MSVMDSIDSGSGAGLRSAVNGIVWPAILPDGGAHLLALNFQLERSQWWPHETIERHQLAQLRALMTHAVERVPFYRTGDYSSWLRSPDKEAWTAFRQLPLVTRTVVQHSGMAFYADSVPDHHGRVAEDETSGSTGVPLRYKTTALAGVYWNAIAVREHFWHKRVFSARHAFIRSRPEAGLAPTWGFPSNQIFACGESANLPIRSPDSVKREWLTEMNPHYLMTTPSTLRALMEAALSGDLQMPNLREVRTVGETVTDSLRKQVRQAWGVEIVDIYSSSECGLLALQCPESGHFHAQSEWAITEVLDPQGHTCSSGEIGRIVVTPLHNFSMPLVRYDTGDFAEVGESCPCGRNLPRWMRILGRRRNRLHHPDGRTSWPNLSSLPWSELAQALSRFQLQQRRDLSLVLRHESTRALLPDERSRLEEALLAHLGCRLPLAFEQVDALPLSTAGKLEDFVTDIDDPTGVAL